MGAKLLECGMVIFAGGIGVGVVVIFGGDNGDVGVKIEKVTIVFVGFVDEVFGTRIEFATFCPAEGGSDGVADWDLELMAGPN